jgi:hypothetical protein
MVARAAFGWNFILEGKMAGGGSPGGLPLILRFSRAPGRQPARWRKIFRRTVNLPLKAGTLVLVNFFRPLVW